MKMFCSGICYERSRKDKFLTSFTFKQDACYATVVLADVIIWVAKHSGRNTDSRCSEFALNILLVVDFQAWFNVWIIATSITTIETDKKLLHYLNLIFALHFNSKSKERQSWLQILKYQWLVHSRKVSEEKLRQYPNANYRINVEISFRMGSYLL